MCTYNIYTQGVAFSDLSLLTLPKLGRKELTELSVTEASLLPVTWIADVFGQQVARVMLFFS